MNANLLRTSLYICGLVAAAWPAWAGPLQRADVSADPTWAVHVDCDSLRPTAIGQYLLAEMAKPEAQAKLNAFQAMCGFDLRNQLHGLTLYSTGKVPKDGVLLVYGDFEPDRLIAMVKGAQDYQATPYKQHTIHNWIDDKKKDVNGVKPRVFAAAQGMHILVISQQEPCVAKALDVLDRAAPSLAGSSVFPQLGTNSGSSVIQAAARKLDIFDTTPSAAVFRLAKSAELQVVEAQGQVKATLNLETTDPDVAQQVAMVGQGLVALMKLQQSNPIALKLAQALALKQEGAGVVATAAIPSGEIIELMKADATRKAQKKAEKE